jgi:hypothetical protein
VGSLLIYSFYDQVSLRLSQFESLFNLREQQRTPYLLDTHFQISSAVRLHDSGRSH